MRSAGRRAFGGCTRPSGYPTRSHARHQSRPTPRPAGRARRPRAARPGVRRPRQAIGRHHGRGDDRGCTGIRRADPARAVPIGLRRPVAQPRRIGRPSRPGGGARRGGGRRGRPRLAAVGRPHPRRQRPARGRRAGREDPHRRGRPPAPRPVPRHHRSDPLGRRARAARRRVPARLRRPGPDDVRPLLGPHGQHNHRRLRRPGGQHHARPGHRPHPVHRRPAVSQPQRRLDRLRSDGDAPDRAGRRRRRR